MSMVQMAYLEQITTAVLVTLTGQAGEEPTMKSVFGCYVVQKRVKFILFGSTKAHEN